MTVKHMNAVRRARRLRVGAAVAAVAALAGCAGTGLFGPKAPTDAEVAEVMKASFRERGIAKLDRLEQNQRQKLCTEAARRELTKAERDGIEAEALASVRYPADGKWLGDWQAGERIAQSGVGMQYTDRADTVNGGNCYACHQLKASELAYGNIGPSLLHYGKLRGTSEATLRYTWGKIWNAHAYNACTAMPRFGDAGVLTENQIRDVMALLLDPASPVNQ